VDGLPPVGDQERARLRGSNSEAEGLAVLRDKSGETAVLLDYGPALSRHVHPAKLNMVLYAHGDIRLVDPGRAPYGNPVHKGWYRQTIAHNTVVVNKRSQEATHGRLEAYAATDDFAVVRAACDSAYRGVELDRTVFLRGNAIADIVQCRAPRPMTFDLPLHFRGLLLGFPPGTPATPFSQRDGYGYLRGVQRLSEPVRGFTVDTGPAGRIRVDMFGDSEVFLAQGMGENIGEWLPMLVRRQRGTHAGFVTVYQILEGDDTRVEPKCVLGESVRLFLGDAELEIGKKTAIMVNGTGYSVKAAGIERQ